MGKVSVLHQSSQYRIYCASEKVVQDGTKHDVTTQPDTLPARGTWTGTQKTFCLVPLSQAIKYRDKLQALKFYCNGLRALYAIKAATYTQ